MSGGYSTDELLALSGIQHYAFCPRQWALIHIERQWADNLRTVEGNLLHERVDNPYFFEARGGVLTARSVPISSYTIGLYGVSDVVEFVHSEDSGVFLPGYTNRWIPIPVEYKRGKPKPDSIDEVQLCAQAMCLEEMLRTEIKCGYLYYGQTKHRTKVEFSNELREHVMLLSKQMHDFYNNRVTPKPKADYKNCKACSLFDICLPKLRTKNNVRDYMQKEILGYDL